MNLLPVLVDHRRLTRLDGRVAERADSGKLNHVRHLSTQPAWNERRLEVGMVNSAFPHCEQTTTCVMSRCGEFPEGIPSLTSVYSLMFAK